MMLAGDAVTHGGDDAAVAARRASKRQLLENGDFEQARGSWLKAATLSDREAECADGGRPTFVTGTLASSVESKAAARPT